MRMETKTISNVRLSIWMETYTLIFIIARVKKAVILLGNNVLFCTPEVNHGCNIHFVETGPSGFTKCNLWHIFTSKSHFALGNNLWIAETDEISWQFIMCSSCITIYIWDILTAVLMKGQTLIWCSVFLQTATDSLEEYVASFFSTLQMETTCSSYLDFMFAMSPLASSDDFKKKTHHHHQEWRNNYTGIFKDHQQIKKNPWYGYVDQA